MAFQEGFEPTTDSLEGILSNISDAQLYKHVGNSDVIPFIKRLAENIKFVINESKD